MAKTIPHRELRNNSSEILRQVQSGETFNITNHGEVVATLTSSDTVPETSARVRKATIAGRWDEIPMIESDLPTEQVIDELRGE